MESTHSTNGSVLAYAALSMAFGLISSAFNFYYVKIFLNFYHIEESWFQFSQVLYLIWNAINDPLFAYVQDTTNFRITRTRRESILYVGPFFALSFIIPWFPWASSDTTKPWIIGLHLIFSLCFWDTMFTYVGLGACCLFTEISTDKNVRVNMIRFGNIGSLIGSSSIMILEYVSGNLSNYFAFQMTTVAIAVLSAFLFLYTGFNAHTEYDRQQILTKSNKSDEIVHEKNQSDSIVRLTLYILTDRDFLSFVIANFLQDFHRTFLSNFLAIICDELIPQTAVPTIVRSTFYGIVPLLSQMVVIIFAPIVGRIGYFQIFRASYVWKICGGMLLYLTNSREPWVLMTFFLMDSCLLNTVSTLNNLPLSDVADKDRVKHRRKHPISSMVFGTNALIVKPAQSLSPMFVVAILNRHGYEDLKKHKLEPSDVAGLDDVMFDLMCLLPVIVGVAQMISWSFYTIRDQHKRWNDIDISVA